MGEFKEFFFREFKELCMVIYLFIYLQSMVLNQELCGEFCQIYDITFTNCIRYFPNFPRGTPTRIFVTLATWPVL
jgi:hypothetical protein